MLTDINKRLGSRWADSARSGMPNQADPYQRCGGGITTPGQSWEALGYLGGCHCLDGNGDLDRQAGMAPGPGQGAPRGEGSLAPPCPSSLQH